MDYTNAISLTELLADHHATILAFNIGTVETTRLASLGFTPGTEVSMTQNYGRGPLLVTVRGTSVALGRMEAAKIFVERRVE
ncbi:MAG TPA: ferrous iron transport protein A [Anaerolineales bacterium]|nr:ferrous iron transport protein A [Anaerolineales bacterium]